jgi:uncharacterized membrane protein
MDDSSATVENPGPIQLLAVAFPGSRFKGRILPELDRLKRKRLVRVLDMLMIRKDFEGNVAVGRASDLDWGEATALGSYLGALAGMVAGGGDAVERGAISGAAQLADGHIFDEDYAFRLTEALGNDTTAVVLLIEHTWAKPLLEAIDDADGVELLNDWVQPSAVLSIEPPGQGRF